MKEAEYISRTEPGDPELEFENLRKVGIDEIQKLSGNKWTDFNLHDPGITILEQLCYAITELGYKTAFDIKDLLASQKAKANQSDTFFSPAKILEGKPITINDYRRLLIDRVNGLRDVWIEPLVNYHIKGLYRVLIQRSPERIKTKSDKEKLINDTRKTLEKYSNLGEAFSDIEILEELELKISEFNIDLKKDANVEKTHAQVLYKIKDFISSPIKFHTLNQMLKDFSVDEIFDGPRLNNGFIKNEDLKVKKRRLLTSHLINILDDTVDGVLKVRSLELEIVGKSEDNEKSEINYDGSVFIEMNKVAVFANSMLPYNPGYEEQESKMNYFQNAKKVMLFQQKVISYYRQLEKEKYIDYILIDKISNDIPKIKGNAKPIGDYYSIQEHFPAIYATGSRGIPPSFESERVNQVKQLKTYLLIFEQILTNYLAQLTHFADLFSLNQKVDKSYFPGSLETVPYIEDLLIKLKDKSFDTDEIKSQTKKISQKALQTIDNFYERRNQVLDHLLARFGEKLSVFGLERFNYYYDESTLQKVKISAKLNFLKDLVYLSSNRARSFNSTKEFWTNKTNKKNVKTLPANISYLEKKVKTRLGIKMQSIRIADYFKKYLDVKQSANRFSMERVADELSEITLIDHDQLSVNTLITKPKFKKESFNSEIKIDDELIRRGIWVENYKLINFKNNSSVHWVGFLRNLQLPSGEKLVETKKEIHKKLVSLSEKLNPKPKFLRFWIEQNNCRYLVEFEKQEDNDYNSIPTKTWSIIKELDNKADAEKYIKEFSSDLINLNINMEGFYLIDHIELRPRHKSSQYQPFAETSDNKTINKNDNSHKDFEKGNASFFSFRISVLIPTWPSRFADLEFRKELETIFLEDAPAHIAIDFYYLDYTELADFENIYNQWLDDLRTFSEENIDQLNESSKDIVSFLKVLENKTEEE